MDLPGEKLIDRMWETVFEKGIGGLLKPWQTARKGRAEADVRAYELRVLAQAQADADDLKAGRKKLQQNGSNLLVISAESSPASPALGYEQRVEPTLNVADFANAGIRRSVAEAAQSEINASRALLFAEEILANSKRDLPNASVDEEWIFAWRDHVGKVSNEDLQRIWGRVLAGEVESPKKYSLRTMQFLRTLSRDEAEKISRLAPFVLDESWVPRWDTALECIEKLGLEVESLMHLQHLGIIGGLESQTMRTEIPSTKKDQFYSHIFNGKKVLAFKRETVLPIFELRSLMVTEIGKQLLSLCSFEPNMEFLKFVGKHIAAQGFKVTLGDIEWESDESFISSNKIEIID